MCPTILKPRLTPGVELYTKMKLHQATNSIENTIETKRILDPIHNWFFNYDQEDYAHKVVDFANARYQPTIVDLANDPFYRTKTKRQEEAEKMMEQYKIEKPEKLLVEHVTKPSTPIEKTTTLLPHTQNLDQSIEQKRKTLKELLSKTPLMPTAANKKDQLKSFITSPPTVVENTQDKREEFKNFIDQKTVAHRSYPSTSSGRAGYPAEHHERTFKGSTT